MRNKLAVAGMIFIGFMLLVALLAQRFRQVEDHGDRQAVIAPGQRQQRLAGVGLQVGGIDNGETHGGQALPGRRGQPTGRVSAADENPPHARSAEGFRTIWTVRGFLLLQIASFLAMVLIHFGLLIGGYRHLAAGTTESLIAAVLVAGLLLTWTPPPWSRRTATAAQSFGTLGVLVGLLTIAVGVRPRTILDLTLNGVLLLTLIAGLAITTRQALGLTHDVVNDPLTGIDRGHRTPAHADTQ